MNYHFAALPRCLLISLFAMTGAGSSPPLHGQCTVTEIFDPADTIGERLGFSSAVYGSRIVVGATGPSAGLGVAKVFDLASGELILRLSASSGGIADAYGQSVAISDSFVAVGADFDDEAGGSAGAVYVFDATTGAEIRKLTPHPTGRFFGASVCLSGTTLLVGSQASSLSTIPGLVHAFDLAAGALERTFTTSDIAAGSTFGTSLAVDGNLVLVGAPTSGGTGAAYLFDFTTGQELMKLEANSPVPGEKFGISVAIDGTRALVGADERDDGAVEEVGVAYLFDLTTGAQVAELEHPTSAAFSRFGRTVALDATTALVASSQINSFIGTVAAFDATTGEPRGQMRPSSVSITNDYGCSITIDGSTAYAGACRWDGAVTDTGAIFAIDLGCLVQADFVADELQGSPPLTVQFSDFSTGEPIDTWTWDFGDGGTSTLANPTYVYTTPGTYDVELTVSNEAGFDVMTKSPYIVIDSTGPSSVSVYNGTGLNPLALGSSDLPIIGETWSSEIDGSLAGATGGLVFVFGYEEPLVPGLLIGPGELLIDVSSPFAILDFSVIIGGVSSHNIIIPNDLALLGRSVSTQGFVNQTTAGGGQLTNALVLVFGTS